MARKINSIQDVKVGNTIKHISNWYLSGEVVEIEKYFVRYKSIITGLTHPIHIDDISDYEII